MESGQKELDYIDGVLKYNEKEADYNASLENIFRSMHLIKMLLVPSCRFLKMPMAICGSGLTVEVSTNSIKKPKSSPVTNRDMKNRGMILRWLG